tara:strand:+ start:733 stop:882 length:150 start_codon:yes stop_codon:yes gene_type:complete
MKIGVTIGKNDEIIFDDFEEAMDYIENIMPEVEALNISTDDIKVEYYGS